MKPQLLTVAAAATTLVACGAAPTAAVSPPTTQTARSASATAPPTALPASPTAAPLPPLAILTQFNGAAAAVSAVDAAGNVQWALTPSALDRLLSGTFSEASAMTAQAAGPNVVVTRTVGPYGHQVGHLAVIDRGGHQIGGGTFTQTAANGDSFVIPAPSPTGTEWAWSVEDGATPNIHGRILVAGIGEAAHTVFPWVAPAGSFGENVAAWTDMGLVLERMTYTGCGLGFASDSASFLIDPATGALTDLFNGDHYGDARHGVRVALPGGGSAVTVNGTTFGEKDTVVTRVQVSPDGATVGVQRLTLVTGCGSEPTLNTELINVATRTHTDVAGCGFNGWFDSTQFVCSAINSDSQTLETVGGRAVGTLGRGNFVGAISG